VTTYADQMIDCAALSAFGYSAFLSPFSYAYGAFPAAFGQTGYGGSCGQYANRYAYAFPTFIAQPPRNAGPTVPPPPSKNPFVRPPRRQFGDPRSGLSFSNPTRRNSPEHPAPAPHSVGFQRGPEWGSVDWAHRESPRSHPQPGGSSSGRVTSTPAAAPAGAPSPQAQHQTRQEAPRASTGQTSHPVADKKP
jgi:hypothetical protein